MALNIFDTASGLTTPVAQGQQQPFSITNLLQDRNFLSLLAGVGAGLDPKGIGGAIGIPTQQSIASQAAQERAAKQASAQNAQTRMVIEALNQHGGLTPDNVPGVTSVKAKEGGVQFEVTPHADGGNLSGSGLETPTAVAPTAPAAPTTPSAGTQSRRGAVNTLLPFYSRLLNPTEAPWLDSILNK